MTNRDLAAQARMLASLDRRAWLCIAACLDTTSTPAAARAALADLGAIGADGIRSRAEQLLDQLTRDVPASQGGAAQEGTR